MNEPATTDWQLEGSLTDSLPPADLPNLIERAAESNPELQRLAQELNVERSHHSLLKAERIPNLDLQFGLDFNAPRDFNVGPRGQISLGLPLFYRNQGEIAQSLATERVLEAEAAATRRSVEGNVERAYLDLAARQTQVDLYGAKLLPAARHLADLPFVTCAAPTYLLRHGTPTHPSDFESRHVVVSRLSAVTGRPFPLVFERDGLFALQSAFAVVEETVGVSLGQP